MVDAQTALDRADEHEKALVRYRTFKGPLGWAFSLLAAGLVLVTVYEVGWGKLGFGKLLPLYLGLTLLTVFALFPAVKRWEMGPKSERQRLAARVLRWLDVPLALAAAACALYVWWFADELALRAGDPSGTDVVVATVGLVLLAEAARRAVGLPMTILATLFVGYATLAHLLPPDHELFVRKKRWPLIAEQLWYGNEGVFDIPIQVVVKYVLVFVLLGAVFKATGVGRFFIELAYSLTGHRRGGPAKTAVLASALMGTVSGSSIANAVTTGSFTIPMMKRVGYRPEFAAAVEASASTGGQIMPPIMGAAAFVMVEILGIPYRTIVVAAIIPAVCFFFGAWVMVHLEAKRRNLPSIPKSQLPRVRDMLRKDWIYLLPFVLLLVLVMDPRGDILKSAVYVAVASLLVGVLRKETRPNVDRVRGIFDETARNMAGVAMACAAAGVIGGIVKLTGLGFDIVTLIGAWSGGIFFVALILTMFACLILGMGLPTTATYILVVTLAAPGLIRFEGHAIPAGITELEWQLVIHMFVFFYGVVADVTPPVALAAYAASGIAGSDQFKTGWEAFKISLNKFLVPFAFVFQPAFLLLGLQWGDPIWWARFLFDLVFLFVGVLYIHAGLSRFLYTHSRWYEAAMMLLAGALMMFPSLITTGIGIVLALVSSLANRGRAKRETPAVNAA